MQPTLGVEGRLGLFGHAEITGHDVPPSDENFSIGGDALFHPGNGRPDRTQLDPLRSVDVGRAHVLGQAIALDHRKTQTLKELTDFHRQSRPAGNQKLDAPAQSFFQAPLQDQAIGQPMLSPQAQTQRPVPVAFAGHRRTHAARPAHHPPEDEVTPFYFL